MAFFAEAQAEGLSPREVAGRAALRAATALGNKAVFDAIMDDVEAACEGRLPGYTPEQIANMVVVTATHAVKGTLHLNPNWVNSHENSWAPARQETRAAEADRRVRVPSGGMNLKDRVRG